jgi:uncharacterized SAM-binding protein YcdF (DUF218 family)
VTALAWSLRLGRQRRTHRRVLAALAVVGLAWAAGFAWFVRTATLPRPPPPVADGIVALTGGADRVRAGLLLLAAHRADRLLVTGIGGHAGFRDLARQAGLDPAPLAARVTLGRGATSTRGNAEEIAAWARTNALHSLIVVTAFYHMPRALTEIGRALPDVALYPSPVSPAGLRAEEGLSSLGAARLLAAEYTKFLGAELGLTAFGASGAPRLSAAHTKAHK